MDYKLYDIVFVCGGSGGHVYPAIAMAQELSAFKSLFVGTSFREDSRIIPAYGLPFLAISGSRRYLSLIPLFFRAFWLLLRIQPRIIIGTGASFTVSVIFAAFILRIPIFLMEQNIIPGRANRLLRVFAKKIFTTYEETAVYLKTRNVWLFKLGRENTVLTGNPVRKKYLTDSIYKKVSHLEIYLHPVILIFGGSQGASAINTFCDTHYKDFIKDSLTVIHITGETYFKNKWPDKDYVLYQDVKGRVTAIILPYFERMDYLYMVSDAVVSRAGATTIAELNHFNKPAVLIPFPFSKDNHQLKNAKAFEAAGMGLYLDEAHLNYENLKEKIKTVFQNGDKTGYYHEVGNQKQCGKEKHDGKEKHSGTEEHSGTNEMSNAHETESAREKIAEILKGYLN
ncbi:glycosyltransferase [Thermoproteota archaeon]